MHNIIGNFGQDKHRFPKLWGSLTQGVNLKLYLDIADDALGLATSSRPELKNESKRITIVLWMIRAADSSAQPAGSDVQRIIAMIEHPGDDSEYTDACEFVAKIVVGHEKASDKEIVEMLKGYE